MTTTHDTNLREIITQLAKFTVVGAFGTVVHYTILILLVERAGTDPVAGSSLLESIRQLLGGRFLEKNEMLLSDAGYSAKLAEIYSATTYEITNLTAIRDSKVAVDVTLSMGSSSSMETRLIVSKMVDPSTQQERFLVTDETSQGI
jgi:hypothetical protein